jgi:phosphoribosylglycinamide formyltransferase-1
MGIFTVAFRRNVCFYAISSTLFSEGPKMESNSGKVRVLVFASGDEKGGGSGFQELVEFSRTTPPVLDAQVVGVVSNHEHGGVRRRADALHIPFEYWTGPFEAKGYRSFVEKYQADFVMCSGWLKFVRGLDPARTVNIHPGPLPRFGGQGMYGHHVHEAVIAAFRRGEIIQSAVSMHFVDETAYDHGPIIFQMPVLIRPEDDAKTLAKRVNEKERAWQSYILNLVVHRRIYLEDGEVFYKSDVPRRLFY